MRRMRHGLPLDGVVFKEHDGLSTYYVQDKRDLPKPNYPMPAIRCRTFESLRNLGYVSALNGFDIDVVFNHYIKD